MSNHHKRLIFGFAIAVLVLTALFLLLAKTSLAITAYCFSLLAPVMFFGTLWHTASSSKNKYITNAAFPIQSYSYCTINLIVCGIFVLLDQTGIWSIPAGWFAFIHLILIARFAWRILAMGSGQEIIEQVGEKVQAKVTNWKLIGAKVEAMKSEAPDSCRQSLQDVSDAIRYADPMTHCELEDQDAEIRSLVDRLAVELDESKTDAVAETCRELCRKIKARNTQLKLLK